jgi:hypothetical protein
MFSDMSLPGSHTFNIAIIMLESGNLLIKELKDSEEKIHQIQLPVEIKHPLDYLILKTVKRNSETSMYLGILSSQSVHVCELILSQANLTYKLTHIKEITLSIKLYP